MGRDISTGESGNGGLHIHGLLGPLVAHLGESVLLPCFIKSSLPLEGLQVEWRKMDSLVILFQQGETRPDLQSQMFSGRVDFFSNEVSKGNFSILLKNVVEEDAGVYTCKINTTDQLISSEAFIKIQEIKHYVVTGADRAVFAYKGEDVILNCSVDSHLSARELEKVTWKKTEGDQEVLVLLYKDSEIFTNFSHEHYQGRVELFASEIPKGNLSLKLKDVKMEDKGEFVCEVQIRNMSTHATVVLKGLEGIFPEVVTCSVVSIIRPVMLMKTSPYLNRFPECIKNAVKALALPLYNSIKTISACSSFNGVWIRLIVSLDLLNTALFGLLLSSTKDYFEYICCLVTAAFLVIAYGTYMCVRYKNIFREEKDLLHIMVYMFGAVGLSSVNAIALASELILKAGMSFKDRTIQHFKDDKEIGPEVVPEMEVLSNPHVKPNPE
ncbi:hypothetical protein C0J50_1320 [Silurus asotus]|uniref:Ig-like domain-containing protein n=1 Tax=Silurus asotus TaxID=30991 RepID=A0AAD5A9D4_SILAS|nr:hypothetical protein C0J50_1320 [Silurus asotus]